MTLKEYIQKNKDSVNANQEIRCGSCGNSLQHCGQYEIINNEECNCESVLCETCKQLEKQPKRATRIDEKNGIVTNFVIPTQKTPVEEKVNIRDQFKKINRPEKVIEPSLPDKNIQTKIEKKVKS